MPYIVLAPGAAFGAGKRWPTEGFAAIGAQLARERGLAVIVTGGSTEVELGRQVAAATRSGLQPTATADQPRTAVRTVTATRVHDLTGRTSLPQLVRLLADAALVVANDSGTMHLAAALGRPVVTPIGPTDPTRTGPLGDTARLVLAPDRCSPPCRARVCARGNQGCLATLPVEPVLAACRAALRADA